METRPDTEARCAAELGLPAYLAIKTVASGDRRAARLTMPAPLARRAMGFARRAGAHVSDAVVGYTPVAAPWSPARQHEGGFTPSGTAAGTLRVLYVGADEQASATTELAELCGDHRTVGRLLGYPPCCVDAYRAARCASPGTEDLTANGVDRLDPYPRQLNPVLRFAYGYRLVFHFPCTLRCEASHHLASQHLALLRTAGLLDAGVERHGRGVVLYGPAIGALLVEDGSQEGAAGPVLGRHSEGSPWKADGALPPVSIRSSFDFSIGPRRYADGRHFVARFS